MGHERKIQKRKFKSLVLEWIHTQQMSNESSAGNPKWNITDWKRTLIHFTDSSQLSFSNVSDRFAFIFVQFTIYTHMCYRVHADSWLKSNGTHFFVEKIANKHKKSGNFKLVTEFRKNVCSIRNPGWLCHFQGKSRFYRSYTASYQL